MTRVDFYVLPETEDIGPVLTACRLCERAAGERLRIYAYVPNPALADDIDAALWTFKQGSFVSHERVEAKGEDMALASVLMSATMSAAMSAAMSSITSWTAAAAQPSSAGADVRSTGT